MGSIEYEPAFSLSRWRLFRKCPTAYHLRHHASWGGWSPSAPEIRRRLHALKNLRSVDEWVASLASRSMEKAFVGAYEEEIAPGDAFQLEFRAALHHDLQNIAERKWPDDPKAPALLENPRQYGGLDGIARHAISTMASLWEWITRSPLWARIVKTPRNARSAGEPASAFHLDGIKIWSDPGLCYAAKEEYGTLLFRSLNQNNENEGWVESGLASLRASSKWRVPYENTRVAIIRHSSHGTFESFQNPPRSMVEAIVRSAMAVLIPLEPGDIRHLPLDSDGTNAWEAVATRFPPSDNPNVCGSCQFKTLCPWSVASRPREVGVQA